MIENLYVRPTEQRNGYVLKTQHYRYLTTGQRFLSIVVKAMCLQGTVKKKMVWSKWKCGTIFSPKQNIQICLSRNQSITYSSVLSDILISNVSCICGRIICTTGRFPESGRGVDVSDFSCWGRGAREGTEGNCCLF